MAGNSTITYNRNTSFYFMHEYQKLSPGASKAVDSNAGLELLFTVKKTMYDSVQNDSSAIIQKSVAMNGVANTLVTINPEDVADTVAPGNYYYDIKIKESDGPPRVIYQGASGVFVLVGNPTNRMT